MIDPNIYASGLAIALSLAMLVWLVSLPTRKLELVDALWPLLILAMALAYVHQSPETSDRALIMLFLVTIWSVRLSAFVSTRARWLPAGRHYRFVQLSDGDKRLTPRFPARSLYLVFGLQAIFAWIISLPLLGAALSISPVGWLDAVAVLVWLTGFLFEAVSDQQLMTFRAYPSNRHRVLARGLWRVSRHPNLFGEACLWWGFGLLATAAGAWWGLFGPALYAFILTRHCGIPQIEAGIADRRPGYRDYASCTNRFFPWPRRRLIDNP